MFRITSVVKKGQERKLYYRFYDIREYPSGPPRISPFYDNVEEDNFEYTHCAEIVSPNNGYVLWMEAPLPSSSSHSAPDKSAPPVPSKSSASAPGNSSQVPSSSALATRGKKVTSDLSKSSAPGPSKRQKRK